MRIAALIFAIIGAFIGMGFSSCLWTAGGFAHEVVGDSEGALRGFGGFVMSMLGIIAGGVTMRRPGIGAILFVVAIVGGLISVGYLFGITAIFFVAGAIVALIAFLGTREVEQKMLGKRVQEDKLVVAASVTEDIATEDMMFEDVAPEDIKCPLCGGEMLVRTAKRGINVGRQFHVCARFPECKGKIAIE